MAKGKIKPKQKEVPTDTYSPQDDEKKVWDEFNTRKQQLLKSRNNVHGMNLDAKMKTWDNDYFNRIANIPASELDPDQQPIAISNAFGKIQTALSILIGHNPNFLLDERLMKYSANRELIRALLKKSWQRTDSLFQFLLFIFNMAKRGYAVGRTYHKLIKQIARFRKEEAIDEITGKKTVTWEEKEIKKSNDVAFVNMDNHNVWIDEEARPFDFFSIRDWMWREVWHIDKVKEMFPENEFPNIRYVKEGGNIQEVVGGGGQQQTQQREQKPGMTELYFYENQYSDRFIIEINGVMVVWEPLPQDHKRLSLVTALWNLRSAETIYGVGVIEEMERDETLIDRILNLTLRQLLLCIAPPGFYSGTEDFENENIKLKAGVLRRTLNPNDINWLKIPAPDASGMAMIQWLEGKEEQKTGITKTVEGDIANIPAVEKAFALGISREAGLKRLSLPLKSLQYAFSWEARNRADLIKQVYSVFEVEHLTDEEEIMKYLDEVKNDRSFYFIENEGTAEEEEFYVKRYPEEQLEISQDEQGEFKESEEKKFFKIKPEWLSWEGDIWIDINSFLVTSEEMEKADVLRMTNLLAPLLQQPKEIVEKFVKQILLAFNKDPQKWLPDEWLGITPPVKPMEQPSKRSASTVVPPKELEERPSVVGRLGAAYRAFRQP